MCRLACITTLNPHAAGIPMRIIEQFTRVSALKLPHDAIVAALRHSKELLEVRSAARLTDRYLHAGERGRQQSSSQACLGSACSVLANRVCTLRRSSMQGANEQRSTFCTRALLRLVEVRSGKALFALASLWRGRSSSAHCALIISPSSVRCTGRHCAVV